MMQLHSHRSNIHSQYLLYFIEVDGFIILSSIEHGTLSRLSLWTASVKILLRVTF